VFAPGDGSELDGGVHVQRIPGMFGPRGLRTLHRRLSELPRPRIAVLQFVVQSFGARGANVAFGLWLQSLRRYPLWVMFHEYAIVDDRATSLPRRARAWATRRLAGLAVRAARRAFVSTPAWVRSVHGVRRRVPVEWLPVSSNVPTHADAARVAHTARALRGGATARIVGHFGTYRMPDVTRTLASLVPLVLRDPSRRFVLIGRDGDAFARAVVDAHPELRERVTATGGLPPDAVAEHLAALDCLVEPYDEGVTARRGSVIAGLPLGVPIVTTEGALTEPMWRESHAVALVPPADVEQLARAIDELLADAAARARYAVAAARLYRERFAIERTVEALRRCALSDGLA